MELSERFFDSVREDFTRRFPDVSKRAAVGLAGEGSECFGFDDELSKDHDFGPRFVIWVSDDDYSSFGEEIQRWYDQLPNTYEGIRAALKTPEGRSREGVMTRRSFFRRYTGFDEGPETNAEWMSVPESYLSVVTNGKVFTDPDGEFSRIRERLQGFYPEDVRLKKIAARAAEMAQSGQYNYPRCVRRGESVAAFSALAKFAESSISMIYLLNRKYMPFYKWAHRGMEQLEILPESRQLLAELVSENDPGRRADLIETLSSDVLDELVRQGICERGDSFLIAHCGEIMENIKDPAIKSLHVLAG